jgi:hypothetical protein
MRERIVNEVAAATRARRRSLLAERHIGASAARPHFIRWCDAMHESRDEIVLRAYCGYGLFAIGLPARSAAALALPIWFAVFGPLLLNHPPDGMRLRCSMTPRARHENRPQPDAACGPFARICPVIHSADHGALAVAIFMPACLARRPTLAAVGVE